MLDGKVYYDGSTTKIGDKVYNVVKMPDRKRWLAQNLDWVPAGVTLITSDSEFQEDVPQCCYFNYSDNGRGLHYNWFALEIIMQSLPNGWRVASRSDWENLINSIGGNTVESLKKIRSTEYWPTIQGTDEFGLNLKPNGDVRWIWTHGGYSYLDKGVAYIRMSNHNSLVLSENNIQYLTSLVDKGLVPVRLVKD
jgi:uncharacterized protein (TIGR02145 family)